MTRNIADAAGPPSPAPSVARSRVAPPRLPASNALAAPASACSWVETTRPLAATLLDYLDRGPATVTAKGLLRFADRTLPKASAAQTGFEQVPLTVAIGQDFPILNR